MDVTLVMFKANGQRKDFPLTDDLTIVGRGDDCDLRIPLTDVSRRHCELRIEDGKLVVGDLSSSNGTFVNNKRVTESRVRAGDLLTLGPVSFVVQIDGKPAGVTPPSAPKKKAAPAPVPADDEAVILDAEDDEAAIVLDGDDDEAIVLDADGDDEAIVLDGDDDEAIVLDADDADDSDILAALESLDEDEKK